MFFHLLFFQSNQYTTIITLILCTLIPTQLLSNNVSYHFDLRFVFLIPIFAYLFLLTTNTLFLTTQTMDVYGSTKGRRSMIVQKLKSNSSVSVAELSREFGVSEVTIRKDLNILYERNLIIRTHGGAILGSNPVTSYEDVHINSKRLIHYREKKAIGKAAASIIKEGDTIMLDSGTTTIEIARNLHKFQHLTIITNAINVAVELLAYKRFNVIMLGGNLRETSQSTVGPVSESVLKMFYCDKLFLGVDSFNLESGLSTPNIEEANINQVMISRAKEVIAVFDSSKINKRALAFIAPIEKIDTIVTDEGMPMKLRNQIKSSNINLIVVSPA